MLLHIRQVGQEVLLAGWGSIASASPVCVLVPVAAAVAVLLAAAVVRARCARAVAAALASCRRGARSEARQVLDERYAQGELGTEDYLERVRALGEWM
ncbi:SHOCT domain-containing protein [Sinomonas humi]|uniref:SHOCT domain-containing protein n=1 Tax=Sinomonas humi TaxID=1338436 RepID=A0A0B2ANU5_9MICC|nr:hypothetical protein [Sinomonas humi]KHL03612.1 hypothetical protein LK10_08470 [Sinomonas humi]